MAQHRAEASPEPNDVALGNRISEICDLVGGRKKLAEAIGISEAQLYRYISGQSKASLEPIVAMARISGVSLVWLATGEGARATLTAYRTPEPQPPLSTAHGKHAHLQVRDSGIPHRDANDFVLVPKYEIPALDDRDHPIQSEQVVDHLAFRTDWVRTELGADPKDLVLLSAIGESMDPTIRPGDLLLIDRGFDSIRQDAVYAILHDGELWVKRIQRLLNGALIINNDNPAYREEQLTLDQSTSLRVVGRVVWAGRKM